MNRKASRAPKYPSLVQLMTRGTFYDVGYNVGLQFSDRIKLFFAESDNIQDKLLPFYDSHMGRDYYEKSLKICQGCFPQYVREVRGIADGAGLSFEHVFMANVSKEVYNVLFDRWKGASDDEQKKEFRPTNPEKAKDHASSTRPFQENYGCSDVFINRPGYQYVVHNEDCDPMIKPYGYLLSAQIEEDDLKEQFTSFCYPGFLPGCAFGFNVHGLTLAMNGLYPDHVIEGAPSRHFVNRSLLAARDVEEVVRLARNEPHGVAYGFCVNVSTKEGLMTSVEVGPGKPGGLVHVQGVGQEGEPGAQCHYYHFNSYRHLTEVSEIKGLQSSTLRGKRAKELPPPCTLQQALEVMADTHDPLGPIFRTPRPTDLGETVCTAAFDVTARQVHLYQGREDLLTNTPFAKLPMYQ
ncbi:beta-alanyl-dopamine/carcinine hydrolase-like [Babylonia areolata]|uniref:beta-alanyl-dopamine/carcinine hydrolase-like n=1 Tax=Babylonia areolata TaxID=304850 RepID=UPI003FD575BA